MIMQLCDSAVIWSCLKNGTSDGGGFSSSDDKELRAVYTLDDIDFILR